MVLSTEIGYRKPSSKAIMPILDKFPGLQTVMIGDTILKDVKCGKNVGIKTILYCSNPKSEVEDLKSEDDLQPNFYALGYRHLETVIETINETNQISVSVSEDLDWNKCDFRNTP